MRRTRKLNFPLMIFLVNMLFTFLIWDHYFNSNRLFDREFVSNGTLFMGTLFSIAAGLLAWLLEKSRDYAEAASFESMRRHRSVTKAYRKLRMAHQRLVESEKLASLGQLLTGVVHDLKNPLIAVLGYVTLLQEDKKDKEIQNMLAAVQRQGEHCLKIVQDLLIFARQQKMKFSTVNVCALLDEVLDSLSLGTPQKRISAIRDYPAPPPLIQADPDQLRRIFLNLIMNAWEALEEKNGNRQLTVEVLKLDKSIQVIFRDNGPGISRENLKKIFDPFFTTKKEGQGTGLGLSICYGIIRKHGGKITVRSEESKGASFTVHLPINPSEDSSSGKTALKKSLPDKTHLMSTLR